MSKSVDIVTAGSQKITLWGPQRTPLGILRVKEETPRLCREINKVYGAADPVHATKSYRWSGGMSSLILSLGG